MSGDTVQRAVTALLWTLVGIAKIAALVLLTGAHWLAAATALALTGVLVAVALAWRQRLS